MEKLRKEKKSAVCDDKDPPCFNKKSRALIQKKTLHLKKYHNNNSNNDFRCRLKHFQASLYAITFLAKEKCYHKIGKS